MLKFLKIKVEFENRTLFEFWEKSNITVVFWSNLFRDREAKTDRVLVSEYLKNMFLIFRLNTDSRVFDRNTNLLGFEIVSYENIYSSLKSKSYRILDKIYHHLYQPFFVSNDVNRDFAIRPEIKPQLF